MARNVHEARGGFLLNPRLALALSGAVLVALAGPAHADDPEGRASLWFSSGWSHTSLDEANDVIKSGNSVFERRDFTSLDSYHSVFSLGVELNYIVTDRFSAYAAYGNWFGSSKEAFNRVVEMKVSGTPIQGGIKYRLPMPSAFEDALADLDFFVGAGVVMVPNLEFVALDEDRTTAREFLEERTFSGDALGFGLRMDVEYFLSPKFTLMAGAHVRLLTGKDLSHSSRVVNPNAFNPTGDDDADGIANSNDPDYSDPSGGERGNTERLYGSFQPNPEDQTELIWDQPVDRYLESLYIYDPDAFRGAPQSFQVYDPNAQFDLNLNGIEFRLGLSYYIF